MNKHKTLLQGISLLLIGILAGWVMWGNTHSGDSAHDMSNDAMIQSLQNKSGDAFDKIFLEEMITHHQGAIVMSKFALDVSEKPEIIKLSNDIITAQESEINMMQNWLDTWFK